MNISYQHSRQFSPIRRDVCLSYRKARLVLVRCGNLVCFRRLHNWKSNRYHKIFIPGKEPLKMDENWLLLGDKASFYWWNCHTQQLSGPQFRPDLGQYYELHFLPTYKEGQFPSYMVTIGGSAYIVDGDKITKCQAIQHTSDIERITVINNNRIAVSRRTSTVTNYPFDK
jgi:hypothetical protein